MPLIVYTLKQLLEECENAYQALAQKHNLPFSEYKAKARALAYACNKLAEYIVFLGRQIIPTTAEAEYLEMHCATKNIYRKLKTAAYGSAFVRGLIGTFIPAGTKLVRKSNGLKYATAEDVTLTENPQEIKVVCLAKGSLGNAAAGEILEFAEAFAGLETAVTVKLIGSGADDETDRDLLIRYLNVLRNIYHGGADSDYVKWALEVEGVNRAWCYPCEMGVGSVTVRIMTPTGFPDEILCRKVKEHIDSVRPPTYNDFFVVSPRPRPVNIVFERLIPDTLEVRAAIAEACKSALDNSSMPSAEVKLAFLDTAILGVLQVYPNYDRKIASPTDNIQCQTGELAILGEITWPQTA